MTSFKNGWKPRLISIIGLGAFMFLSSLGNAEAVLSMETKVLSIEMEPYSNEIVVGLKKIESKFRVLAKNPVYACLENALKKDIEVDIEIDVNSPIGRIIRCSL